jgi:hypothetical protein
MQLQTGSYLVRATKTTSGLTTPQDDCVTRVLCTKPLVFALYTNFPPSRPHQGFDPNIITEQELRSRKTCPTSICQHLEHQSEIPIQWLYILTLTHTDDRVASRTCDLKNSEAQRLFLDGGLHYRIARCLGYSCR